MGDLQIGDRIIHLVLREVAIGLKEPVILLVWMFADEFVEEGDCSAVLLSHEQALCFTTTYVYTVW